MPVATSHVYRPVGIAYLEVHENGLSYPNVLR